MRKWIKMAVSGYGSVAASVGKPSGGTGMARPRAAAHRYRHTYAILVACFPILVDVEVVGGLTSFVFVCVVMGTRNEGDGALKRSTKETHPCYKGNPLTISVARSQEFAR
jgi:hypothetical protein